MGMKNFFRKMDMVSEPPAARLHFGNDTKHKTLLGGICTFICILGFVATAVYQGYAVLARKNPNVSS
jgi:hypothetical protein